MYHTKMNSKPKVIAIVGPTASGKSDLAVEVAKKCNGEVVSADSRQVYRGLDIGSGKITKKEMMGVPHHLLDVANPQRQFSVIEYRRLALRAIDDIIKRGKTPILCGGTGFYIQSIISGIAIPEVPPNRKLRKELEGKTAGELFAILKKLDVKRAKTIDAKNPVRLIRAIEIAQELGSVPPLSQEESPFNVLQIGIKIDMGSLREKITTRLEKRIKKGMIAEGRRLHEKGLSWKRMHALGLEYRALADFLMGKITRKQMKEELTTHICQYAKRQMMWFKRDPQIHWFSLESKQTIFKKINSFLKTHQ